LLLIVDKLIRHRHPQCLVKYKLKKGAIIAHEPSNGNVLDTRVSFALQISSSSCVTMFSSLHLQLLSQSSWDLRQYGPETLAILVPSKSSH